MHACLRQEDDGAHADCLRDSFSLTNPHDAEALKRAHWRPTNAELQFMEHLGGTNGLKYSLFRAKQV